MVVATSVNKRKRAGTHLIQTASTTAPAPVPPTAPVPAKPKRVPHTKVLAGGGKALKVKRPASCTGPLSATPSPPPAESPAASPAPNLFELMPKTYVQFSPIASHLSTHNLTPESDISSTVHGLFMEMLNNSFVDTDCPPLAPFVGNDSEYLGGETKVEMDNKETNTDCEMEDRTEVKTGKVKTRKKRAMNYTEVEDTTLCHAWAQV
jgi:hypothetical protein